MHSPLFSIIVITLNEELYVSTVLKALSTQTAKNFEVIVVDANSTDKTLDVVKKFKPLMPLTIVTTPIKNLSVSRNLGAENAQGTYLFFIDADNTIQENFLEKAEEYITKNPKISTIITRVIPSNKKKIDILFYSICFYLLKLLLITPRAFATGPNILIKKDVFHAIKGFDRYVYVGEEHDLIRRLKKKHNTIELVYDLVVTYSTRRFEEQGISVYIKYAYAGLYQIFFSNIKTHIYEYEMGGQMFSSKKKKDK